MHLIKGRFPNHKKVQLYIFFSPSFFIFRWILRNSLVCENRAQGSDTASFKQNTISSFSTLGVTTYSIQKISYNRSTNSAAFRALQWILFHPLPFSVTQIINPFLTSRISANHDKGFILANRGILMPVNVPLV